MENPEELLHLLEEFAKIKPRDIPNELEEYLCFVAKTGDPVYQWPTIKALFREKLINVITEFYEACPTIDIPPCPNVEMFNYDVMKNFILEKLDTFVAAPFTVQRICELLTTPRKEYNRIDKYMRALEKNILVVSTVEPGGRSGTKNGDSVMNGIDSDHTAETSNCHGEINVEEMDESPSWRTESENTTNTATEDRLVPEAKEAENSTTGDDTVITSRTNEETNTEQPSFASVETGSGDSTTVNGEGAEQLLPTTLQELSIPATLQNRRSSVENEPTSEIQQDTEESQDSQPTVEAEKEPTPEVENIEEPELPSSAVKEEDRIILTSTDSGIENISPESSTSPPENLQTDYEPITDPSSDSSTPEVGSGTDVDTSSSSEKPDENPESLSEDSNSDEKEQVSCSEEDQKETIDTQSGNDFEVTSSVEDKASNCEEATPSDKIEEDEKKETNIADAKVEEKPTEVTDDKLEESKKSDAVDSDTLMEVDSSNEKVVQEANSATDV